MVVILHCSHGCVVLRGSSYDEKCDVYSFGVSLWEICSRRLPYDTLQDDHKVIQPCLVTALMTVQIMREILDGRPPPIPEDVPKPLQDLLKRCWDKPENRPSFCEIVKIAEKDEFLPESVMDTEVSDSRSVCLCGLMFVQVSHEACLLCKKLKQRQQQ